MVLSEGRAAAGISNCRLINAPHFFPRRLEISPFYSSLSSPHSRRGLIRLASNGGWPRVKRSPAHRAPSKLTRYSCFAISDYSSRSVCAFALLSHPLPPSLSPFPTRSHLPFLPPSVSCTIYIFFSPFPFAGYPSRSDIAMKYMRHILACPFPPLVARRCGLRRNEQPRLSRLQPVARSRSCIEFP